MDQARATRVSADADTEENTVGMLEAEAASQITLLGAEMLTWSDFDGELGPLRGRVAAELLHAFGGARGHVLIAGPHDAEVVAEVAARFRRADVVVRSLPDAERLAAVLPSTVRVHCGPIGRLSRPDAGYDAVVAIDGVERLHSAEEPPRSWAGCLAELSDLLGADGEIYLGVANDAGVGRLLTLPGRDRHDNSHWPVGLASDEQVPLSLDEVTEQVRARHGLARIEAWACYGQRTEPLLAAPESVFTQRRHDPVLATLLGRAAAAGAGQDVPVKDPAIAARTLLRHGLGAQVAPLWVLHLRRGEVAREPDATVLLAAVSTRPSEPSLAVRITRTGEQWVAEPVSDPGPYPWAPAVLREPARLAGVVPSGPPLAVRLADLASAHDRAGIAELVRGLAGWLAPAGEVPAERVPLTFDDVVETEAGCAALDPSRVADASVPLAVALCRMALLAASVLLARGGRHPWPRSATPRAVATSLVAAVDIELDDALFDAALTLDARLRPAGEPVPDFSSTGAGATPEAFTELTEQLAGYQQALTQREEQLEWLLVRIHQRQRAVLAARARADALNASPEYRIGSRVLWLRALWRRLASRSRARRDGPAHLWTDRGDQVLEREPIAVDKELLPPGYHPKGPLI